MNTAPAVASEALCEALGCPALQDGPDGWCPVHRVTKRVLHVMSGTKCTRCEQPIELGQYITRASTLETMTHASCPRRVPSLGRKRDQAKPLLEAIEKVSGDD